MKTKTILKERIIKKEKIKLIRHKMNTMLKVKVMMTMKKMMMKMIPTRTQTRMILMKVMIAKKMRMSQIGWKMSWLQAKGELAGVRLRLAEKVELMLITTRKLSWRKSMDSTLKSKWMRIKTIVYQFRHFLKKISSIMMMSMVMLLRLVFRSWKMSLVRSFPTWGLLSIYQIH